MVIGENGIFSKSNTAKEKTNYTSAKEILDLKLLDIEAECKTENKEYTIEEIEEKLMAENEKEVLIVAYYHDKLSAIKSDVTRNITNLKGIAVKIDKYDKYTFLIGEMGEIEGATTDEIEEDTPITAFEKINTFEKEKLGITTSSSSTQTSGNQELVAIVPKMTSNTQPYGEASASTSWSENDAPWCAFDPEDERCWCAKDGAIPGYIMYHSTAKYIPKKVVLKTIYYKGNYLKDFRLEGSNDGENFDVLYEGLHPNDTDGIPKEREYTFYNNNVSYEYFRLYGTSSWYLYNGRYIGLALQSLQWYGILDE